MVKVEVKDELVANVRTLHGRYKDLDTKHLVTVALEDFLELTKELRREGRR
jgi:hypothetical protein